MGMGKPKMPPPPPPVEAPPPMPVDEDTEARAAKKRQQEAIQSRRGQSSTRLSRQTAARPIAMGDSYQSKPLGK